MNYAANFLAGAFICNCIPHLVFGLGGQPFPTPFAKPRGVGESTPLVTFVWGSFNAAAGTAILVFATAQNHPGLALFSCIAGGLAMGVYLSLHFGKVRSKDCNR